MAGKGGSKGSRSGVVLDKCYTPKVTKDSLRVHCREVSTGEDSGHRELKEKDVQALVDDFLGGQYGQTVLKKPILRSFGGKACVCKDGLLKLVDGKKVTEAMKRCWAIYENEESREKETWSPKLIQDLEEGMDFSEVEVENDDDSIALKWCAGVHAEESIKIATTTIRTLIKIGKEEKARVPGGSWDDVRDMLRDFYGKGKQMFVYRIIVLSRRCMIAGLSSARQTACRTNSLTRTNILSATRACASRRTRGSKP